MRRFFLGVLIFSALGAECSTAVAGDFPKQLGGISLGMSRVELTERLGARDVTGVPEGATKDAAIFALMERERGIAEGRQKFEILRGTTPRVVATVDEKTREVIAIEIELQPKDFLPTVLAYSADIGHPTSTMDVFSYDATWLSKGQDTYLQATLKIGMGAPSGWLKRRIDDGTVASVDEIAVFEKTRVLLARIRAVP